MKLKKVVVEGFRAYESAENGTFDFSLPSGQPADFVAIFAPNGFGKTSFYDAVEYALTGNISRFVRDAYRSDYDNKSKTQIQRERKQYVLRNHSIGSNAVSRIQVTLDVNGIERTKTREITKPKAGSRDFLFKKDVADPDFTGLADVFLSQEAIDTFLREEKADARYLRFMSNFGDSDEVYRANLGTLKRELESTLEESRAAVTQLKTVVERPINPDIFAETNQTIASLATDQENIEPVGRNFNADQELRLRSQITKRLHELTLLHDSLHARYAALRQLAAQHSTFATASERKRELQASMTGIASTRTAVDDRTRIVQGLAGLRSSLAELNERKSLLTNIALKMPTFEQAQARRKEALDAKNEITENLRSLHVQLASLERREVECARRITAADAEIQRLLNAQRDCASVYLQIDAQREVVRAKELERNQQKQLAEAIDARLSISRRDFEAVRAIKIGVEFADLPELALLASDEFSPTQLRASIVEMRAKQAILEDASKALDLVKRQANSVAELVTIGRSLIAESHSSHCPLCTHDHGSFQALLDSVLQNPALSNREEAALQDKQRAAMAFEDARVQVDQILRICVSAHERRIELLRESIQSDEKEIGQREEARLRIERELAQGNEDLNKLRSIVLDLPSAQFIEKISGDIETQKTYRDAELRDRDESKLQIGALQANQKDLLQRAEAEQAKADAVAADDVHKAVLEFCTAEQVDKATVRGFVEQGLNDVRVKTLDFESRIQTTTSSLAELDEKFPSLAVWNADDARTAELRIQEAVLGVDSLIVPFLSSCQQHLPKYEGNWSTADIESCINSTIPSTQVKIELNDRLHQNYTLLNRQLADIRPFVESLEAQIKLDVAMVKLRQEEALEASLDSEYRRISQQLNEKIQRFFYPNLTNSIYRRIDPHPDFKQVEFACDFEDDKPTLEVFVADAQGDLISPNLYFSAAQVNILSLSIFLARALHAKNGNDEVRCIFVDDPIHSMDSINVLSTIDLLRSISLRFDRQIVLSTHDRNFFELLKRKLPPNQYSSKFLELETFGKVVSAT